MLYGLMKFPYEAEPSVLPLKPTIWYAAAAWSLAPYPF